MRNQCTCSPSGLPLIGFAVPGAEGSRPNSRMPPGLCRSASAVTYVIVSACSKCLEQGIGGLAFQRQLPEPSNVRPAGAKVWFLDAGRPGGQPL